MTKKENQLTWSECLGVANTNKTIVVDFSLIVRNQIILSVTMNKNRCGLAHPTWHHNLH